MPQVFLNPPAAKVWNSDKQYVNFSEKPMKFRTEGDLRKFCRSNHVESGALL